MRKKLQFLDRRLIAFMHDVVMVVFAWLAAYTVHQNLGVLPKAMLSEAMSLLPFLIVMQMGYLLFFGLYRSVWRFASLPDLIQILKASVLGVGTLVLYSYFLSVSEHIPRSIPLLYVIFLILSLSFGRLAVRWYQDHRNYFIKSNAKRVLLIGSENEAESLIREMLRDPKNHYRPVAILDLRSSRLHREIHRVPVVGTIQQMEPIVEKYRVDMIFIAVAEVSSVEMSAVLQACVTARIPYRIIASYRDETSGHLLSSMREVNLDDLLGRDTYAVSMDLFHRAIQGKRVLITGGGGSIGSELCRQIAFLNPAELFIIDHAEINLYQIDLEIRERFPHVKLQIALMNILNEAALRAFFEAHRPEIVFHAAAYKHVPLLEEQIIVAVRNNVLGSKMVADLSVACGVETFIQVSTDKAVRPTNIMGMTKRAAEIYCQSLSAHVNTKIVIVRFGNVLGSAGSVVPLFQKQLQAGGPLTVTHPEVTRYFMTIPEACRLILQAMTMGQGGEVFVLDMGDPIKIKDLAIQIIRLAGKIEDRDIKIVYTGLRKGEKLQEELFYEKEAMEKTAHKKIFRASADYSNIQFVRSIMRDMIVACQLQEAEKVFACLLQLVPEYQGTRSQEKKTHQIVSA